MTRVLWTRQAIEDVEAIRAFVARDSPHYATLIAERMVEAVQRLQEFPRSGRVVPELERDAYREIIFGAYRIVHRLEADRIEVLAVVHAARRFPGIGNRRER